MDDHDGKGADAGIPGGDGKAAAAPKAAAPGRPLAKPAVRPPARPAARKSAPRNAKAGTAASEAAPDRKPEPEANDATVELRVVQAESPQPTEPEEPAAPTEPAENAEAGEPAAAPRSTPGPQEPKTAGTRLPAQGKRKTAAAGPATRGPKATPNRSVPRQRTAGATEGTGKAAGPKGAAPAEPPKPAQSEAAQPKTAQRKAAQPTTAPPTAAGKPAVKTTKQQPSPEAAPQSPAADGTSPDGPTAKPPVTVESPAQGASGEPTAPQPAPGDGTWQVPGYLHESDLGAGPCGRTVRARSEADGTAVAITYLSPELAEDPAFREAFPAEAERLAALESPYVARLYAFVADGPHAAVVREPVEGAGLDALLRESGPASPEAALAVLKGSLRGLAAVHEAGVVHGAAHEPANVVVGADGGVHLVEVGVAARGADSGVPEGAAPYTAPERWAGAPAAPASDLYAATAVFHAHLTGAPPYQGGTADELASLHAEAPVPADRVPEPVRSLVVRGLAKVPAERHQSAADFAVELEAVAVAAYGEDWEERGRAELGALAAPLLAAAAAEEADPATAPAATVAAPLPPPAPQAAPAYSGTGAGAGIGEGVDGAEREPRFGRRGKILALAVAAVLVAGALTVTAVATGGKHDAAAADPTPTATVSPTASPAATSASPSAAPTASPTATTPSPTATSAAPSTTPASTPSTAPTTAAATHKAAPPKLPKPPAGSHVTSVAVTGFECSPDGRTASATVSVRYDGTTGGTLHATWWRSANGTPQGAITMTSPQAGHFPKGSTSFTFTDKLSFTPDPAHPYIGLSVSTDPAAKFGDHSFRAGCR
ncbi:Serine/threonine protein kinase [Actinacidiphila yanglinensis]|uniref:non-specific serine/threonine protein kinase n=1 Tax=Actinacidiphila yanglinensis TaxID=310779 RepID=A0A1H5YUJ6_9ACTN|nr:serine/threonine-protein kinase [Actinacidiphila yanglinensis]SEG27125.1 Serine/threonine protein kinase [Actinacidiphila yanglinensis]